MYIISKIVIIIYCFNLLFIGCSAIPKYNKTSNNCYLKCIDNARNQHKIWDVYAYKYHQKHCITKICKR
jgi:hypothetical protein